MYLDKELYENIKRLTSAVSMLAKKYEFKDYKFWSYSEYFDDEPNENEDCATLLTCDSGMLNALQGYSSDDFCVELYEEAEKAGFWFERENHYTLLFYNHDEKLSMGYQNLVQWEWITSLVQPEFTNLYEELFQYFSKNPKKLYSLSPRQFEIYIGEVFRNQGYGVELGPGRNDGGVDLRLFQKTEIDQITTLVQVKRYKDDLPINLEAVAALSGHVHDQEADQGLFITTSRFLPSAKRFAERQKRKIRLSDTTDLSIWSREASTNIIRNKSQLVTDENVLRLVKSLAAGNDKNLIVVSPSKAYPLMNRFALVLKETPYAALLMDLPVERIPLDPPYNSKGYEVPVINESIINNRIDEKVFRTTVKSGLNGLKSYYGNRSYFDVWDGNPAYFDLND